MRTWEIEAIEELISVAGDFPRQELTVREIEANARITVQSLHYENPLELVIFASGAIVIYVLRMIRDWPARRRNNNLAATEYENGVIFRQKLRDRILDAIDKRELPISPELVESLLTDDVANAISAVADADLQVLGLPGSTPDNQ
ncbi:MAG: hypothetical protein ABI130_09395 [Leifsonia sp.]